MLPSKLLLALAATAIFTVAFAARVRAQDNSAPGGPGGATSGPVVVMPGPWGDPEQMRKRFEEFRKQLSQQTQKDMGATDDEWKVLEPKIQKVTELSQKTRTGGTGFRFRLGDGAADNEKPTAVDAARKNLQKVLDDKNATPDEVKKALAAFREARDKAKQDAAQQLEKAQKDLRELLTQRQEAYLVARGLLD